MNVQFVRTYDQSLFVRHVFEDFFEILRPGLVRRVKNRVPSALLLCSGRILPVATRAASDAFRPIEFRPRFQTRPIQIEFRTLSNRETIY